MKTLILSLTLLCLALAAQAQPNLNEMTLVGQYDGEAAEDHFGVTMTCGDFNGDGYDEFIIGATGWNGHTGKSYIYPGGVQFPAQPAWTIQGQQANEGYAICSNLGDISGDNIDDFAIGTNTYGTTVDTSKLDIYFGSNPIDTIPDLTIYSAYHYTLDYWRADSCGDVNGDGGRDFAVVHKAYGYPNLCHLFWGGAELDTIPDITFSAGNADQIDGLGDVNGDGFADIMLRNYQGPALIYFGGSPMDTIPDVILNYGEIAQGIGSAIRDFNQDGFNDIVNCVRLPDSTYSQDAVYWGGLTMDNLPDLYLEKWDESYSASLWGQSCGDLNGDSIGDIVGTTAYGGSQQTVQIHLGRNDVNVTPDAYVSGWSSYEFGNHVSAGDINGDGMDELLIGELNYPWFHQGRVLLYQGPLEWTDYGVGVAPPFMPLEIPEAFELQQNFPNPFNDQTRITFLLQKASPVNIEVFNIQGKLIKNIMNVPYLEPGMHYCQWDATDDESLKVSAGVYMLRIESANTTQSIKMVLLP